MKYHDTHFHLDLVKSPEELAIQIENAQIYTIAVTNSPSVFFYTEEIAKNKKYIRAALGLHPELVAERHKEIKHFLELLPKTKYVGEVGLDNYNKTPTDYAIQKQIFEKIVLACSEAKNKILTIHSRRAASDTLEILSENFEGKIILHWYSDSLKQLEIAVARGYYFSINLPMLQSTNGKKIIDRIPIKQILIETDGPFTKFNSRSFTPLMAEVILDELAIYKAQNLDPALVKSAILTNFKTLLEFYG